MNGGLCSNDFISKMPDDVCVKILSLLPIKEAAITSILSTRWRFSWRKLIQLNFDGTQTPHVDVLDSEEDKYINQVNDVIQSYNHPTVQEFRIRFGFNRNHKEVINKWFQFAVNKNVEFLELDFTNNVRNDYYYYDFPVSLFGYLKKLILKKVYIRESFFSELLKSSSHLETISICDSQYLDHISVGGRSLTLKHIEIEEYDWIKSICLSDFDLESFTYKGPRVLDLRLAHLPKLKRLKFDIEHMNSNVFGQISSSGALSLQSLFISIYDPKIFDSIPELPHLKELRLEIGGSNNDCLVFLASIMNACPNLETFTIKPLRNLPTIGSKQARTATNPHEHLKHVEFEEYYGGVCDFELAAYIMHTAESLLPKGVELVII